MSGIYGGGGSGSITTPVTVPNGGTGSTSFNINGVVISGTTTTSPLTALTLTDGQVVIGKTGLPPVAANISAGTNIAVTNGAGTISIATVASPTFTNVTVNGTLSANAAMLINYVQPGAYPYTVLATDNFISVDSSAARTINLPNAATTNQIYTIKDRTGSAGTNNISITTLGGVVNIDGVTTYKITSNYGAVSVIFNGTSYEVY